MYTFIAESEYGATINLAHNETEYKLISVEGLNPPQSEVYTTPIFNISGAKYKSSRTQMRNIVITIAVTGNVETNRLNVYRIFRTGHYIKLLYTNEHRSVYIEGYVETITNNPFIQTQQVQISVLCPQPYWKAIDTMIYDLSKAQGAFVFPFAIDSNGVPFGNIYSDRAVAVPNYGDVETGIIIRITANEDLTNLRIAHEGTGEYFIITGTLNTGDTCIINTYKGEKNVTINGESAFNRIGQGSTWFILATGDNAFSYSADSGASMAQVVFEFTEMYEGV